MSEKVICKANAAKKQIVSEIKEKFEKAQSVVVVHYSGITVEEVTKLRNQFREAGVEYCVLKNKLVDRALDEMQISGLNEHLTGPNAYAFGMKDPVSPAKVIYDFIEKNKKDKENLSVKGGLLGTEVMDEAALKALSQVPSREVLLARLVGSIHAPVSNLVYALDAIAKKKEEAGA
jgi:large subunit ribosomal protein L10